MALGRFGITITPGELNARLKLAAGFDARGRLRWGCRRSLDAVRARRLVVAAQPRDARRFATTGLGRSSCA